MRIGSVAAAPFVGSEFVSLYLGAERVPTVPGKPVIEQLTFVGLPGIAAELYFNAPANDGGEEIFGYRFFLNGQETLPEDITEDGIVADFLAAIVQGEVGDVFQILAANAVGEGPLSDPVAVTAA
jgi:hypothetical protein